MPNPSSLMPPRRHPLGPRIQKKSKSKSKSKRPFIMFRVKFKSGWAFCSSAATL